MAVDALALCVIRSSTAMVLNMHDRKVLVVINDNFNGLWHFVIKIQWEIHVLLSLHLFSMWRLNYRSLLLNSATREGIELWHPSGNNMKLHPSTRRPRGPISSYCLFSMNDPTTGLLNSLNLSSWNKPKGLHICQQHADTMGPFY